MEITLYNSVVRVAGWRRLFRAVIFSTVALCAQSGDWAQVQALAPGAQVEVKRFSEGRILRGAVESVSADALVVQSKNDIVTVNRDEVRRVHLRSKGKTTSGRVTGVAVLGGLAILSAGISDGSAGGKAAGVGILAGLGYLVGWAIDGHKRVEVYEAPKP